MTYLTYSIYLNVTQAWFELGNIRMASSDASGALTAFTTSAAAFKRFAPRDELRPTVVHNAGNALLDLNRLLCDYYVITVLLSRDYHVIATRWLRDCHMIDTWVSHG